MSSDATTPSTDEKRPGPPQAEIDELKALYQSASPSRILDAAVRFSERWPDALVGWKVRFVCHHNLGQIDDALQAAQQVVRLDPQAPDAHSNLGVMLQSLGRLGEAEAAYRRALALQPEFAEAHNNLGNTLNELGRAIEAEEAYRRALAINPNHAQAHYSLGGLLAALGRPDEAQAACRRALAIRPDHAEAHCTLGNALRAVGRLDEAEAAYRQALAVRPDYATVHSNLGATLNELGRPDEAEAACRQALAIAPDYAEAYNNLGTTLTDLERLDEAEAACRKALTIHPEFAEAHNSLGNTLKEQGRIEEAIESYRQALTIDKELADAHLNLAFALLLLDHTREGWEEYEWRWKTAQFAGAKRELEIPKWDGGALTGRLLVWSEQGVGDELMFSALLNELTARGIECVYESAPRLVELFSRSFPEIEIAPRSTSAETTVRHHRIEAHAPLASLPYLLKTSPTEAATTPPFLVADRDRKRHFIDNYSAPGGPLRVGISWRTQSTKSGACRNTGLMEEWRDLLTLPKVRWINLQYGDHSEELRRVGEELGVEILSDSEVDPLTNLDDFAAQVAAMDLVISIDNSTVHMAGGLGVPTWALLPSVPDFRWRLESDRSPWYPTVTLIRQTRRGEWREVFERVERMLKRLTERGAAPSSRGDEVRSPRAKG